MSGPRRPWRRSTRPAGPADALGLARNYIRSQRERYVETLRSLVRVPSVTADAAQCRAAARLLMDTMTAAGLSPRTDPVPDAGPTLFARAAASENAPAVIGYAHYDVKPAGDPAAWTHDPWAGDIDGGRMYGRGVVDNKSGCLAFVFAAEACLATGSFPVDLRLVIEGEEEAGSVHLEDWALAHPADMAGAGGVFCLDGSVDVSSRMPRIDLFGRGILYVELSVETASADVHSGQAVLAHNAAWRLIEALRTIKDVDADRVIVPGWADDLVDLTDDDREYFHEKARTLDPEAVRAQYGLKSRDFPGGREGGDLVRALYVEPTCTICGLWAGETTPGVMMTAVPRRASVKLDFRCPPRLDATRQAQKLREHLDRAGFQDVEMRVLMARGQTWHTPHRSTLVRAIRQAGLDVLGVERVVDWGIPTAEGVFAQGFRIAPVLTGFANPDCHIHAADENLVLDYYLKGIEYAAAIFFRYAEFTRETGRQPGADSTGPAPPPAGAGAG
jgi:acetylornithine deacetylase/succinyl-diaminopimelate desuccinylase-like protein